MPNMDVFGAAKWPNNLNARSPRQGVESDSRT